MTDASRRETIKRLRARLKWWDREIDRLKERVRKMELNERLALNAPLQSLISDRERTQQQIQQLERRSGQSWNDLIDALDDIWKKMDDTLRRTGQHPDGKG